MTKIPEKREWGIFDYDRIWRMPRDDNICVEREKTASGKLAVFGCLILYRV